MSAATEGREDFTKFEDDCSLKSAGDFQSGLRKVGREFFSDTQLLPYADIGCCGGADFRNLLDYRLRE
jgi:hypothetical protein